MRMTLCTLWVCMHDHIEVHPQNIGACMNAEKIEFYRLNQNAVVMTTLVALNLQVGCTHSQQTLHTGDMSNHSHTPWWFVRVEQ